MTSPVTRRGQAMVETALALGLLIVLAAGGAEVARLMHYSGSLDTVSREAAFQAALAGHSASDGERAGRQLWRTLQPDGAPLDLRVATHGRAAIVTATSSPMAGVVLTAHASHTIETFAPGSGP